MAKPPKPLPITAITFGIEAIEQIDQRRGAAAEGSETLARAVEAFAGGGDGLDFSVGEIVAYLISHAEMAAEGGQGPLLGGGYAGEEAAGADGEIEEWDRFQRGEMDAIGFPFAVAEGEIEGLAGDHAVAVERCEQTDLEIEEAG